MKKIINLKRDTKGQSMVEFAFVAPVLLLLILGMIEFGWILNGKITLSTAAREGARFAVVNSKDSEFATKIEGVVKSSMSGSGLIYVKLTSNDLTTNDSAQIIVNAKIKPIVGLFFKEEFVDLTAKAEMRIEK